MSGPSYVGAKFGRNCLTSYATGRVIASYILTFIDSERLTMVHNTKLCPLFNILKKKKLKKTKFRKLDLFPSSGEGVGDTYPAGSVRKS
jgi:hypothetical protein